MQSSPECSLYFSSFCLFLPPPNSPHLSLSCTNSSDDEEKVRLVYDKSATTAICLLLHPYMSSQTTNLSSLHFWSFTVSFVNHCCHSAPNLAEWQAALSHICLSDCTTQDKRGGGVEGGGGWFGTFGSSAISQTRLQRAARSVSDASQDLISHLSESLWPLASAWLSE